MHCSKCGCKNENDSRFCQQCGSELSNDINSELIDQKLTPAEMRKIEKEKLRKEIVNKPSSTRMAYSSLTMLPILALILPIIDILSIFKIRDGMAIGLAFLTIVLLTPLEIPVVAIALSVTSKWVKEKEDISNDKNNSRTFAIIMFYVLLSLPTLLLLIAIKYNLL